MKLRPDQIDFAQQQRKNLIAQMPSDAILLAYSGDEQLRNRDVSYSFRAQSDFWYLSGFAEPKATLVLIGEQVLTRMPLELKQSWQLSERVEAQAWLWLQPKDPAHERWEGTRLGVEGAIEQLKFDQAWAFLHRDEMLAQLLAYAGRVYVSFSVLDYWMGPLSRWIVQAQNAIRQGGEVPMGLLNADPLLHSQRLVKSPFEIEQMRQAAQMSVEAHLAAMRVAKPGVYEFQVQAALESVAKHHGALRMAFNSIVAGGDRACVLHYTENQACLTAGELVLIDAGVEWQGFAGDISHTFPVSGRFSSMQKSLYELVLAAQHAAISVIKPGIAYDAIHQAAVNVITRGLVTLGLLAGEPEEFIASQAYKAFFMHGTGHWLGLDVHDVGPYKRDGKSVILEAGMVLTVEPGIYIDTNMPDIDSCWHGIGIRIEDDVLVTDEGFEVLTQGLPRTPEEIEAWIAKNRA